eukprot:CAMPEP_0198325056 /NCGR_PEP_ID=MMETSP1450-20131203/12893_1 /TAXON_ID=753684 ORGANISM="Madagascaria erythrocladiodes, Strain CCMP3234" /NCGR_SAMPLE_ID=MMETSP1450 /ASSEMBLY_ACC=CAM_ASM_001115 /LENGTH=347 /DNA_ID=CAMNT_0044028901 /DNA_START=425 /DNA_END=1468 /DNA_ORIENTATION=+
MVRDESAGKKKTFFRNRSSLKQQDMTKTQAVEIWSGNHKPKFLYSPITETFGKNIETEAIACNTKARNLVRQGEPFHITVQGFYVTPQDFTFVPGTELFMYALEYNGNDPALMKNLYDYRSQSSAFNSAEGNESYVFTSVPAPGNLLATYERPDEKAKLLTHLDVHLRLVEVTDSIRTRRLINDISKLNSQIVPNFSVSDKDVLTEVLDTVGSLSQGVVDEVSNPETAFHTDIAFKIAPEESDPQAELDSYLRYGVYYFLKKPSRAKLYAQTSTMQNARLMVKMVDQPSKNSGNIRPEFAEFAETTYISMRVHRGADDSVNHSGAPTKVVTLNSLYSRFSTPRYVPR